MVYGVRPPRQEIGGKLTNGLSSFTEKDSRVAGLRGLFNSGNTCYMNAALQACLLHNPAAVSFATECKAFYEEKLQSEMRNEANKKKRNPNASYVLTIEVFRLLQKFSSSDRSTIYPKELLSLVRLVNPEFAGGGQHDSSLFCKFLLECLHESTKQAKLDEYEKVILERNFWERELDSDEELMTEEEKLAVPLWKPPRYLIEREISFVSEIYRGKLLNEVSCHDCGHISRQREVFWDLAVEVPYGRRSVNNFEKAATKFRGDHSFDSIDYRHSESQRVVSRKRANSSLGIGLGGSSGNSDNQNNGYWVNWVLNQFRETVELRTVLCHFFVPEDILKSDYKCAKCRKSEQAISRKCSLIDLPETLIITLKRFRYEGNRGFKVGTSVVFPTDELDLREFLSVDAMYDTKNRSTRYYLGGVVCHKGSLFSGHYITFVRLPVSPEASAWYEFDDANVRCVSVNDVKNTSAQAYVLVYYKYPSDSLQELRSKLGVPLLNKDPFYPVSLNSDSSFPLGATNSELAVAAYYLISRLWVWRFRSFSEPGKISNAEDILCPHGHAWSLESLQQLCYQVDEPVWNNLLSRFSGGPPLLRDKVAIGCDSCQERKQYLDERRRGEKETVERLETAIDGTSEGCWYLIDTQWLSRWYNFCMGYEMEPPGPITNGRLLRRDGKPLKGLVRGQDYRGINEATWNFFLQTYGDAPDIKRKQVDIYSEPIP